jgi:hypothetical protein
MFDHKMPWDDYTKKYPPKTTEPKDEKHQGSPSPAESKALLEEFEKIAMNIITRPEVLNAIRNAVKESEASPGAQDAKEPTLPEGVEKLPEGAVKIGEEVELVGEKINYKVALNPEIFYFYNIFKAEAERRGKKWTGDFGDFIYMAAKDALTTHGILPAIVRLKEGQMILKVPMEGE